MFSNDVNKGFISSIREARKIARESVKELHRPIIQNASMLFELHAINQHLLKLEQAVKTVHIKLETEKADEEKYKKIRHRYEKYSRKLEHKKTEFEARYKQVVSEPNQEVLALVTSPNHYHDLLLKLNEATYLILFKERLEMIRDHSVVSQLRDLLNDLAKNRLEALLLTPFNSINMANFSFIFTQRKEDMPIAIANYFVTNLQTLTRKKFAELLVARAELLTEILKRIRMNSSLEVKVQLDKRRSFKNLFMEKVHSPEEAQNWGAPEILNIVDDLQAELDTITQLQELSQKNIIKQTLKLIAKDFHAIYQRIMPGKNISTKESTVYSMPLSACDNFDTQLLQEQIDNMNETNRSQVLQNLATYQTLIDSMTKRLLDMEFYTRKIGANLEVLEAYGKTERFKCLEPFQTLIQKFTAEHAYLLTIISNYKEKIERPISIGELSEANSPMRIKKK